MTEATLAEDRSDWRRDIGRRWPVIMRGLSRLSAFHALKHQLPRSHFGVFLPTVIDAHYQPHFRDVLASYC